MSQVVAVNISDTTGLHPQKTGADLWGNQYVANVFVSVIIVDSKTHHFPPISNIG